MKKTITFLFLAVNAVLWGQSMQIQNMASYLRNKELAKAKTAADAAEAHPDGKSNAKMWLYRGKVYHAIFSDTAEAIRKLDSEAEEKSLEAYINCMKLDKDQVYKDEAKGPMIGITAAVSNKANYYRVNKQFDKALRCYDLMEASLPYDFDQGIKRNNITKEKVAFYKFETYQMANNFEKMKEYADKLIAQNYKEQRLFTDMVKVSLANKDTATALQYIDKGKQVFEDNMDLITSELDIYISRKQTDVLKNRLQSAIEVSPDNEVLHLVLANLYRGTNQPELAEKEYLRAVEIRPDYEPAVYNLGVLFYTQGKEWNDKLNGLPMKDPKVKEYEAKTNEAFKKAVGYFETSYAVTKDKRTKQILRQLFLRLGDTAKADEYK